MVGAKLGTPPPGGDVDLTQPESVAGAEVTPTGSAPAPLPAAATTPTAAPQGGPAGTPATTTRAPAPTTAPPPPAGGGLKNGTFAGSAVTERYGTIKVS